jgi:thiol-disulfide isomerase/thioredoxin
MLRIPATALCCLLFVIAQSQLYKSLNIGDDFPVLPAQAVLNYNDTSISLSGYEDKLLILDFWATWCSACIGAFPKLDSLQRKFADEAAIVLINISDPAEKINEFLNKYQQRRGSPLQLPTIWGNPQFHVLLPHRSIPHYAWIHKGKLIATTGPEQVVPENISQVLQGNIPRFRMKKDILDYDRDRPLLENGNGGDSTAFLFKSFFSEELPGMNGGYHESKTSVHRRKAYVNFSVPVLISVVSGLPPHAIILDVPRADKLASPVQTLYSYEITAPINTPDSLLVKLSLADLNKYLGISAIIKYRKLRTYKLVMTGKRRKNLRDSSNGYFRYNQNNTVLEFNRKPVRFLISHLNDAPTAYPSRIPFVDGTRYTGTVNVTIPNEAKFDLPLLKQMLSGDGIKIRRGKTKMKVCVIRRDGIVKGS